MHMHAPPLAAFPKGYFDDLCAGRMSLFEWIDLAATLGVDGLELYPDFFASFEDAYLDRVAAALQSHSLAMPMLCHSPDFTQPDPQARAAEVVRSIAMIDLVARFGGRSCRVLSGQARQGLEPQQALAWVVSGIKELLSHAEARGVTLVLENHYKDGRWRFPEWAQRRERFLAILDAIPSPILAVNYDPSNAILAGDDPYELLEAVLPRVASMHASDRYLASGTLDDLRQADGTLGYSPHLRHGIIGQGLIDYDRVFGTLAGRGFAGWISIEDGEAGLEPLQQSVAFLREKIARYWGSANSAD
jgi:sugar phosphate isomerase/epimerase